MEGGRAGGREREGGKEGGSERERGNERERGRERETDRQRQTDRDTDRYRQTERQTDRSWKDTDFEQLIFIWRWWWGRGGRDGRREGLESEWDGLEREGVIV